MVSQWHARPERRLWDGWEVSQGLVRSAATHFHRCGILRAEATQKQQLTSFRAAQFPAQTQALCLKLGLCCEALMAKVLRFFLSITLFFCSFFSLAFSQTVTAPAVSALAFEPNRGQTAPEVMYLARSREGTVFLTKDGVTVAVPGAGSFRMRFESASNLVGSAPERPLRSHSNYFIGPRQISGLPNYGAVRYQGVYAGTDVVFYGRAQHL